MAARGICAAARQREATRYNVRMGATSSTSASSSGSTSAEIAADIRRLVAPADRPDYDAMLTQAIRGRTDLPDDELRRMAETAWRQFVRGRCPTR